MITFMHKNNALYKYGKTPYKPSNCTVTNHIVLAFFIAAVGFLVLRITKRSWKVGLDCGMKEINPIC